MMFFVVDIVASKEVDVTWVKDARRATSQKVSSSSRLVGRHEINEVSSPSLQGLLLTGILGCSNAYEEEEAVVSLVGQLFSCNEKK